MTLYKQRNPADEAAAQDPHAEPVMKLDASWKPAGLDPPLWNEFVDYRMHVSRPAYAGVGSRCLTSPGCVLVCSDALLFVCYVAFEVNC